MHLGHVFITHTSGHPWAIVAQREGTPLGILELHTGLEGSHRDWKDHLAGMRESGDFEWVRWVSLGFNDEEWGGHIEIHDGFTPTPYERLRAERHRAGEPFYMPF